MPCCGKSRSISRSSNHRLASPVPQIGSGLARCNVTGTCTSPDEHRSSLNDAKAMRKWKALRYVTIGRYLT